MIIVFDIGASKMRVAQYADGILHTPLRRSTPVSFSEGYALLSSLIRNATHEDVCTHIVGGIRGTLSVDTSRIAEDSLLSNWVGKPLVYLLEQEFSVPVTLAPASMLAVRGEHAYGAAIGAPSLTHISVGATVAAASVMSDGSVAVHHGDGGDVFETLSDLIGGAAFAERYGVAAYDLDIAHDAWGASADYLAHGIAALAAHTQSDMIVLGGAMVLGMPRISIADTIHATHRLIGTAQCPMIIPSKLGDDAVLYGAAAICPM